MPARIRLDLDASNVVAVGCKEGQGATDKLFRSRSKVSCAAIRSSALT
jgi:hypothetical protein